MLSIVFSVLFIYSCLFFIGIGPTLLFYRSTNRIETLFGIAPSIGLLLTTIVGTYLVLFNYPVSSWGIPWLIISLLLSFCITAISIKKERIFKQQINLYSRSSSLFVGGLLLTTGLLIAPMLIGGLNFTVLRGNGSDTFNYITMAGYLLHEPYASIFHSSTQVLVDKHFSYGLAQQLLNTRWSTSMLLAWSSAITHLPGYQLEHGFTLLFFMITYGIAYLFGRQLKMPLSHVLLAAIATSVGFWGQLILDIRALSHISVLPFIFLFVYLLTEVETLNDSRKKHFLLGITFTGMVFLYVELIPTVILGTSIFITIQFLHGRYSINKLIKYWVSALTTLITMLPAAKYLMNFFSGQANYALHGKNNWHLAYFSWLYEQPVTGFWGLSPYTKIPPHFAGYSIFWLLGVLLLIYFFLSLSYILLTRRPAPSIPLSICSSFSLATLLECIYLQYLDQLWAAGKVLSYGYPFILYTLIAGVFSIKNNDLDGRWNHIAPSATENFLSYHKDSSSQAPQNDVNGHNINGQEQKNLTSKLRNRLATIGWYIVLIWLIFQCALGLFRIINTVRGKEYPTYIGHHGEYQQHDWDISSFVKGLELKRCNSLGIQTGNIWLTEYFNFAFGWDVRTFNLDDMKDRAGILNAKKTIASVDCLLVHQISPAIRNPNIIAQNKEFFLIKVPRH